MSAEERNGLIGLTDEEAKQVSGGSGDWCCPYASASCPGRLDEHECVMLRLRNQCPEEGSLSPT